MSEQEILKKAIEKAVENGYSQEDADFYLSREDSLDLKSFYLQLVYSHEFAKAIFGTKKIGHDFVKHQDRYEWQRGLEEMVISENPILYLKENGLLEGGK